MAAKTDIKDLVVWKEMPSVTPGGKQGREPTPLDTSAHLTVHLRLTEAG